MKALSEINEELNKFIKLQYQRHFSFPPFSRPELTEKNITDSIILLYRMKDIVQNNTYEEAKKILSDKRRDIIKKIKERSQHPDSIYNYIIIRNLTDDLFGLNWVLGREQFDKEII